MGISNIFKTNDYEIEALFFNHLATYVEPYNANVWLDYCDLLKRTGRIKKCYEIAKTGFLFNPSIKLAQ